MGSAILGSVAEAVEALTRPPARPVDLTLPPSIENEDPTQLIERARKELKFEGVREYNVAVVSASSAGKASFINAFRMIEDSHQDAATVESSNEMRRYPHPILQGVVLWSLPTAGVPGHPALTYFTEKKVYAFDCVFVVSAERFERVDFEVAKAAVKFNAIVRAKADGAARVSRRQLAFVRAKADEAVKRVAEREKVALEEACKRVRGAVEGSFREGLRLANLADIQIPLFLVSTKGTHGMDHGEDEHQDDEEILHLDDILAYKYVSDSLLTRARRSISMRPRR